MTNDYVLLNDIVNDHNERMQNLKRYYPFFKLQDHVLTQYKEGQYDFLDMGYLTMAVLRFFIEENHLNDRDVTYRAYEAFMDDFLKREYAPGLFDEDFGELIQYIFNKLCNDGRPFVYSYYEPKARTTVNARMKLIESRFVHQELVYRMTSDAIDFYLDTKEVKDESKITADQLILEKLLRAQNFKGGLEVVRRINSEVSRLIAVKDDVVLLLHRHVFEGVRALRDFTQTGLNWFEEEQKLFAANKELVEKALKRAGSTEPSEDDDERVYSREDIYELDRELKRAMRKHSDLLAAATSLQIEADTAIARAKHSRFRNVMSFDDFLEKMVETNQTQALEAFIKPLFSLKLNKTMNLFQLEDLLEYKPDEKETGEQISKGEEQAYIYEDEKADERIGLNFDLFLKVLCEQLVRRGQFDLKYLAHQYTLKFTEDILKNGDYYAFLVHLSQKKDYDLGHLKTGQDTFLEGIMAAFLKTEVGQAYQKLKFTLEFIPDEKLTINELFEVTNIQFQRRDD